MYDFCTLCSRVIAYNISGLKFGMVLCALWINELLASLK